MIGIENIIGKIESDVQAEIHQLEMETKAQADAILSDYRAKAQKEVDDILTRGERDALEHEKHLVSAAKMESKKQILAAKQEMLDQVFDLTLKALLELPEAEYVELLSSLATKAASTGREQILMNQQDRSRYGKKILSLANKKLEKEGKTGAMTLSRQTRQIQGGLLVSDGAIEVNCALETLVRLLRGEVTGEVSKILFP